MKSDEKAQWTLLKGGTIVTMDKARRVILGDILIKNSKIEKIGRGLKAPTKKVKIVDCTDKFIIPGLIQTHVHLCQVLYRGEADDLALLDWLERKIWPMEVAHNRKSIQAAAKIAILEMQLSGTTTVLDMGTVKHTNDMIEAVSETGMRYWGGKCLMDDKGTAGPLYESTKSALQETMELMSYWKAKNERIEYVLCPRFAISCTEDLLLACADIQKSEGLFVHTHASENLDEIKFVKKRTGFENIDYFGKLGLLNSKTIIVHGVHVTRDELKKMVKFNVPLVHCPSANLKLASGIAPISTYLEKGLVVGLGSDGAPCNNSMDQFKEVHLAAMLQKPFFGPEAMPAEKAFEMATISGAKVLGVSDKIGSLEVGKLADITVVDRSYPSVNTVENPYSALVYSCTGRDVTDVMIGGKFVVRNRQSTWADHQSVLYNARTEKARLSKRMQ